MNELVEVKKHEAFVDSALVARKFGMKHQEIVRMIERVLDDFPDLREISNLPKTNEKYFTEERAYRGQPYTAYMMNRSFFSLVAMRFTSKQARQWQRKFNTAFYELENQLMLATNNLQDQQWLEQRSQAKALRKAETDVIKEFVDYATMRGSTQANYYYNLITKATYRALGLIQHGAPKLRDTLDSLQLAWLVTLESIAQASLLKYMRQDLPYKDIYRLVADDLERYAEPLTLLGEHAYIKASISDETERSLSNAV
jgi:Rha family phage regulatory protein